MDFTERLLNTLTKIDNHMSEIKKNDTDDPWKRFKEFVMSDHLKTTFGDFPEEIIGEYLTKIIRKFLYGPNTSIIKRLYLKDRLDIIKNLPENYFKNMSDVNIGRIWSLAGIQDMRKKGVTEYHIFGEVDEEMCSVCHYLNCKGFSVESILDKIDLLISDPKNDDLANELFPFPKMSEIDNRVILPIEGFLPPFHPGCRCTIFPRSWSKDDNSCPTPPTKKMLSCLELPIRVGVSLPS